MQYNIRMTEMQICDVKVHNPIHPFIFLLPVTKKGAASLIFPHKKNSIFSSRSLKLCENIGQALPYFDFELYV
jgi:hypothetical protein